MAKLRRAAPRGNPAVLLPYRWKAGQVGNPCGRSQKKRVSDAVSELLEKKNRENVTRAAAIASNLLDRAETDSEEVRLVLEITEPGLLVQSAGGATAAANVMIVDNFSDGVSIAGPDQGKVLGDTGAKQRLSDGANGSGNGAGGNGAG